MKSMNNISVEFFKLLNGHDISYAVLRNYKTLPEDLGGSDVDLWVSAKDVDICMALLGEAADKAGASLVSFIPGPHSPKICYLNGSCGFQVDLFKGDIRFRNKVYFSEDDISSHVRTYNGIRIIEDDFAALLAFLKELLNNGKVSEKYIKALVAKKSVYDKTYLRLQLKRFSNWFCNRLADCITNENFSGNVMADMQKAGFADLGIKGSRKAFSKLKNLIRIFRPAGYTIAVLGTDGSGKSFIINSITPILNEAFHNGIRYEHMRPNYLPSLAVASGRKKASEEIHATVTDPHSSEPSGLAGSILRLSYYWLDYTWGYFRKIFLDKSVRAHVWLFDRYYYDYYVDQRRARLHMPEWIIRFFGIFVPAPDLTICLGGEPEKIYARKPETSLVEVARQTKLLKDFSARHKHTVWVDTDVSPEESVKASMDAIVCMMAKRFSSTSLK